MAFAKRALAGRRILVTRPRRAGQSQEPLAQALWRHGAEVLWLPGLEIGPPDDWGPLDRALGRLASFDWVVFTSQSGVAGFAGRLAKLGQSWSGPPSAAAVGSKTADALTRLLGPREVHVSPEPLASALAASLAKQSSGRRFLWPRAEVAPDLLARELMQAGAAEVCAVAAYAARVAPADTSAIRGELAAGQIDAVTFTSARSVAATIQALGSQAGEWLSLMPRVCIGPVTAQACRALGLGPPTVADGSLEGLVRAVVQSIGS